MIIFSNYINNYLETSFTRFDDILVYCYSGMTEILVECILFFTLLLNEPVTFILDFPLVFTPRHLKSRGKPLEDSHQKSLTLESRP